MSTHDRGAFGMLLAEAKALGDRCLTFDVDLMAGDEDVSRWTVSGRYSTYGRTGEEALRAYVEALRAKIRP